MYIKNPMSVNAFIIKISFFIAIFYNLAALPIELSVNHSLDKFILFRAILAELLLATCIVIVFLYIFSFSKILLKFWICFFIIVSSILSFYMFNYKLFVEESLIGAIMETDVKEVKGAFNILIVPWVLIFGVYPLYVVYRIKFKKYGAGFFNKIKVYLLDIWKPLIVFLVTLGLSYGIYSDLYKNKRIIKNALSYYTPMNYVAAIYQYFYALYELRNVKIEDISKKYNFHFVDKKYADEKYNIVLVIGESARADKQSLNGYYRNTNPNLAKIKNLVSFPQVYSCATLSRISVNCILSSKGRKDFRFPIEESNIISIYKSLGFATYFLSSQTMYDTGANSFYLASKDADEVVFVNKLRSRIPEGQNVYDETLLSYVDDVIDNKKAERKFVVIYITGSHTPYYLRYPPNFKHFMPDVGRGDQVLRNSYDNTILYTDWFLSQVIDKFKNEKTLLYYVADHGESLGENGIYLHSRPYDIAPIEQKHVVQFLWASDSMINFMDGAYQIMVSKKDKTISHDNVFHTLLDCFGVTSSIVNKNLSLCR